MTLQTQQQQPHAAQSRYATMSVEQQGRTLKKAAINGTLKRFTDADWAVFMGSGALGWKDKYQKLFLHLAAIYGHLNQIPHPVWTVVMNQDLLQERDQWQLLFLHRAAWNGYLDQIPHYVFKAMTAERGYGEDFWLGKDNFNLNILDNAAYRDDGKYFPKAMIPALWQGRVAILQTLWKQMGGELKGRPGVREAYEAFINNKTIWMPPKKQLALK